MEDIRRRIAAAAGCRRRGDYGQATPTLVGLATAERRLGRSEPARSLFARAVDLLSPAVADDHPVLTAARKGLSDTPAPRDPA